MTVSVVDGLLAKKGKTSRQIEICMSLEGQKLLSPKQEWYKKEDVVAAFSPLELSLAKERSLRKLAEKRNPNSYARALEEAGQDYHSKWLATEKQLEGLRELLSAERPSLENLRELLKNRPCFPELSQVPHNFEYEDWIQTFGHAFDKFEDKRRKVEALLEPSSRQEASPRKRRVGALKKRIQELEETCKILSDTKLMKSIRETRKKGSRSSPYMPLERS